MPQNEIPHSLSQDNTPFNLGDELLSEYPEMKGISGMPTHTAPDATWIISQVFYNGATIDAIVEDIKEDRGDGSLPYHIELVEAGLRKLSGNKAYQNFVEKETKKLETRKAEFAQLRKDGKA